MVWGSHVAVAGLGTRPSEPAGVSLALESKRPGGVSLERRVAVDRENSLPEIDDALRSWSAARCAQNVHATYNTVPTARTRRMLNCMAVFGYGRPGRRSDQIGLSLPSPPRLHVWSLYRWQIR